MRCPCHSGQDYEGCCRPFHDGQQLPQTAEQLMRSRYSAYALELVDYIIATTHHSSSHWQNNEAEWRHEILLFSRSTRFESLTIRQHEEADDSAVVEFRAGLRAIDGRDVSFVERSDFVRERGRWYFV